MSYTISHFYRFGEFAIDLEQRVLLRGTEPVPLTPKIFDTLLVLVEQHGRIVSKDELMSRLWPDSFVEDSNLIFNVQHLRKALGDNARRPVYVETIARRGYRFIADVEECLADDTGAANVKERLAEISRSTAQPNGRPEGVMVVPLALKTNQSKFISRPVTIALATSVVLVASISAWYLTRAKGTQNTFAANAFRTLKVDKLTETGKNRHGVISPDGQYLAYTFEVKGQHGIWLRQLATDSGKEIVPLSDRLGGLAFAHNGQTLYFVKGPPESFALYRVALPLGGVPVRLIEKPQGSYSISPDDSQIAFVRYTEDDKQCALMVASADGKHERVIAIHDQPDRFNTPAWSPDGNSIAVAVGPSDSGSQQVRIVQYNVATGAEAEVSHARWFHISRILWLRNQDGLLIVGKRTLGETKQLWRMNYPSGELTAITDGSTPYADVSLTADGSRAVAPQARFTSNIWIGSARPSQTLKRITHAVEDFSWTPDGRIIYSSHVGSNPQLWIMKSDGTDQRQLTYQGESNINPTITRDGRHIVFSSNRTGVQQIWRMDLDGSNPTQLTDGVGHNLPAVTPDGRWVFYNNVDDWSLWKVSIDGGEPVRLTESAAMFPSVAPDGRFIACVGKGDEKQRKVLIISPVDGRIVQELNIGPRKLSVYRLRWSADGRSLFYAASSSGEVAIYKQLIAGGVPEKMAEFDEANLYDFGYSADGQQLAVTRGDYQFDIVLLSGLKP